MKAQQSKAEVVGRELLTTDIVRLTLRAPAVARQAQPGQFLMVKVANDLSPLLRRPLSIHQCDGEETVRILFKVVGQGTGRLAERQPGELVDILGPLGHGFTLPGATTRQVCLVGGGMGIAPLSFLAQEIRKSAPEIRMEVYLGAARGGELQALQAEFAGLGVAVAVATDDGSLGYSGFVTDLLSRTLAREAPWQFYSCGPRPMLKKVVEFCRQGNWSCQVSLETMMACGISACLGCTIQSSSSLALAAEKPFLHVCKDGPVFDSGDVAWV